MLGEITPVLLTFNEAENLGRTLSSLRWATDIIVDTIRDELFHVK